jgi:hypothetical protein
MRKQVAAKLSPRSSRACLPWRAATTSPAAGMLTNAAKAA